MAGGNESGGVKAPTLKDLLAIEGLILIPFGSRAIAVWEEGATGEVVLSGIKEPFTELFEAEVSLAAPITVTDEGMITIAGVLDSIFEEIEFEVYREVKVGVTSTGAIEVQGEG